MAKLPTVKVSADNYLGYIIINERDFDPDVHTRYDADPSGEAEGEYTPPFSPEHKGGGYYRILDSSGREADLVQGKAKAQARAEELNANY